MGFSLIPIEQARPVRLDSLDTGSGFVLWWDNERGYREPTVEGVVRRVAKGYVSVRVKYLDLEAGVEFDEEDGHRSFRAFKTETTEWSPGTLVIPKEEDEMAKNEAAAAAGAAVPKEKAAPKSKTPENDCWCNCGDKVFNRFKPGHDARFYSQLAKVVAGELRFKDLQADAQVELGGMSGVNEALANHKRPPVAKVAKEPEPNPAPTPAKAAAKAPVKKGKR